MRPRAARWTRTAGFVIYHHQRILERCPYRRDIPGVCRCNPHLYLGIPIPDKICFKSVIIGSVKLGSVNPAFLLALPSSTRVVSVSSLPHKQWLPCVLHPLVLDRLFSGLSHRGSLSPGAGRRRPKHPVHSLTLLTPLQKDI